MKRFFPPAEPEVFKKAAYLDPGGRRQGTQFRRSLKLAGVPQPRMKCGRSCPR